MFPVRKFLCDYLVEESFEISAGLIGLGESASREREEARLI